MAHKGHWMAHKDPEGASAAKLNGMFKYDVGHDGNIHGLLWWDTPIDNLRGTYVPFSAIPGS